MRKSLSTNKHTNASPKRSEQSESHHCIHIILGNYQCWGAIIQWWQGVKWRAVMVGVQWCFKCNKFTPNQTGCWPSPRLPNWTKPWQVSNHKNHNGVMQLLMPGDQHPTSVRGQMKGRHGGGPLPKQTDLSFTLMCRTWYKFYGRTQKAK